MLAGNLVAVYLVASFCLAQAYPALLPYIYNPSKRSDSGFPEIEDDVDELDQLRVSSKRQPDGSSTTTTTTNESVEEVAAVPNPNILPDLERQLEVATPLISTTTTTSTSATTTTGTSKEEGERSQLEEPKTANKPAVVAEPTVHSKCISTKPPKNQQAFYGAARLAFGQNPEVLPTSSTTSTTTTTVATTTTTATKSPATEQTPQDDVVDVVAGEPVAELESAVAETELTALAPTKPAMQHNHNHDLNRETIGDILIDELDAMAKTKPSERRSSPAHQMTAKTAQSLLRNPNGQYSSFDMAQYVFWTGDETGVARAVEELIKENLITRENALKFLRDIRLGIEFLQRSYDNRIFPEELRQNHLKRNSPPSTAATTTTSTTSTTTTSTTTTEKPFPDVHESDISPNVNAMPVPVSVPVPVSLKQLDSLSFWNKLKQMDNDAQQDLTDYDEGRAKIVEYLYNEYSLEEILYKLAKVMFSQSLAHGSDEAQMELQKLTEFLEHEGNLGVIPVDLQKKVLRVLLTALSDTLSEHPELLPAARVNLANPYYRLPMQTPSQ
ncbi:mucin-2 isoform X1 [Drosophila tropicalis]|uniref:mucin-2 isoform X1 n=1 Tax=Drosophila tropicalis TaxID=46794 RepID=UPI0035ABAD7E